MQDILCHYYDSCDLINDVASKVFRSCQSSTKSGYATVDVNLCQPLADLENVDGIFEDKPFWHDMTVRAHNQKRYQTN